MDRELRPRERPKDRDQREAKSSRSDRPSRSRERPRERPSERPRERPEDRKQKGTAKSSETDRLGHANTSILPYRPAHGSPHSSSSERSSGSERSNPGRRIPGSDYTRPHSIADVTFLDAKDLTMAALPDINFIDNRAAQSSAVHSHLRFCARLVLWETFEHEVRKVFNDVFRNWDEDQSNILSVEMDQQSPNSIVNEHYLCGEELSTSGRYVQNVLHVMTAVGKESGFDLQFGDWYSSFDHKGKSSTPSNTAGGTGKGTEKAREKGKAKERERTQNKDDNEKEKVKVKEKRLIPDYALLAKEKAWLSHTQKEPIETFARALGEAKTPSKTVHDFSDWVESAARTGNDEKLRQLLGQVANYMWGFGFKYAFVTNYTDTIFLKWEGKGPKPTLYYSNVIYFNNVSIKEKARPNHLQVSVRESMLFLQHKVSSGDWKANVNCPLEAWVEELKKESESGDTTSLIPSLEKARGKPPQQGDSRGDQSKSSRGRGGRGERGERGEKKR
ncbi:hypothetical protein C8Q69DRAFT_445199 [Paecilomyces variotii]|uniref:Uncharacterized protein n=1 Tax=Byssochlamys spectabilis TaxID=264951 RepID=A0A443HTW6_BYSSP|nr:hypothetical protein C8Q69DRAFT_445199 [Paecilomyces variotii]KAJ9347959.1 hypothetical protein DTO280E4_9404 [Paecilomyces variotii]RWQ95262.1 hypothetical protein C8Q69DRAFT_445199 [Paecilomyces variotii]